MLKEYRGEDLNLLLFLAEEEAKKNNKRIISVSHTAIYYPSGIIISSCVRYTLVVVLEDKEK